MKITTAGLEKIGATAVAVAAAVQSVLVARGIESADIAAAVSSGLAVALGGYHGGAAVAASSSTSLDAHAAQAIAATAPAADPAADPQVPVL